MADQQVKLIIQDIKAKAKTQRAVTDARFFKTGPGEYGEGDLFFGLTMPEQRLIAKKYAATVNLSQIKTLLYSPYHEVRMVGWLMLTYQYPKAPAKDQKKLFQFYLDHAHQANNWDLVDVTAPKVVGIFLKDHPTGRKVLYRLARSNNLWLKRVAVLSTLTLILDNDFQDILKLAKLLLSDTHDLMHKAVGWMLREVGKRDTATLEKFLDKHVRQMPRTMLRYAIEKFPEEKRKYYLNFK